MNYDHEQSMRWITVKHFTIIEILNFFNIIFGYFLVSIISKKLTGLRNAIHKASKYLQHLRKSFWMNHPMKKEINLISMPNTMSLETYSIKSNLLDTGQQQPVEPIPA